MSSPAKADRAAAGARAAEDGHHQRRFAGAVGADQRDDLAFLDRHVDAVQRADVAVIGLDALDAEQSSSGRHHLPPRFAAVRRSRTLARRAACPIQSSRAMRPSKAR